MLQAVALWRSRDISQVSAGPAESAAAPDRPHRLDDKVGGCKSNFRLTCSCSVLVGVREAYKRRWQGGSLVLAEDVKQQGYSMCRVD